MTTRVISWFIPQANVGARPESFILDQDYTAVRAIVTSAVAPYGQEVQVDIYDADEVSIFDYPPCLSVGTTSQTVEGGLKQTPLDKDTVLYCEITQRDTGNAKNIMVHLELTAED